VNTQNPTGRGYWLKEGKVRWCDSEVKGADPATFQPLNHIWGKDAERVYTQSSVNKLADRNSFEVLNHIYAKDDNRVFYLSGWIKEADVKTFRVLDEGRTPAPDFAHATNDQSWNYQGFACDARCVYFDDMMEGKAVVLRGADPSQFKVFGNGFGGDEKLVYYRKSRIKAAKPKPFRVLSLYYATDDERVYYTERAIAGAHAATFEVLADCWARDENNAFFQEHPIEGADARTFDIIATGFARDATHIYRWGGAVLEHADAETFERIDDSLYYRDRRGIYYSGYPGGWIEGADPLTFEVGPRHDEARDGQWTYRGGVRNGPRQD
jgi:hypothetical protein